MSRFLFTDVSHWSNEHERAVKRLLLAQAAVREAERIERKVAGWLDEALGRAEAEVGREELRRAVGALSKCGR